MTPARRSDLSDKDLSGLVAFVTARGSEVLAPTNEWEVARFTGPSGVCVIYRNAKGRLVWHGGADVAWNAWKSASDWRASKRTKRGTSKRWARFATLTARDGNACFFCGKAVTFEDFTIEHLVSLTHGGPDHIANMAVSHARCNATAGHLSVVEKVRLAEEMKGSAQ